MICCIEIPGSARQIFLSFGQAYGQDPGRTQVLQEAKGRYAFILKKGWAQDGLLKQARCQLKAADGLKIEWHFGEKEAADAVKTLFEKEGIKGIDVFHTAPIP